MDEYSRAHAPSTVPLAWTVRISASRSSPLPNSFDEFLPGHVHLNKVGRLISEAIKEAGGIPREFNTMAVDDGIAMGHTGMLYSLPSRDIIADTVEYQVNAHCADALICIPEL